VVTLTWTIDLARRAVTTTPCIMPSASELTMPVTPSETSARTASMTGWKDHRGGGYVNIRLARMRSSDEKLRHPATLALRLAIGFAYR